MTVNALFFFIHSCIELHGVQLFIRSYVIIRECLVYLIYCVHKLLKSNVAWKQFSLSKPLNRTLKVHKTCAVGLCECVGFIPCLGCIVICQ